MNFKKTIAKSLVVAMALGMVPVANLQTAKAAITFSGADGTAKGANADKFWAVLKEDAKGTFEKAGKKYKVVSVQDIVGDTIDVYAALKGKAGIIGVGATATPDANWEILTLADADKNFKVQFIASAGAVKKGVKPTVDKTLGGDFGYLFATDGPRGKETELDLSATANQKKVEVKLNDGSWKTIEDFFGLTGAVAADSKKVNEKLQAFGQSGSALTFRLAGTATAWASKESKIKVATQAKAPAVKIDPAKETTTIKAGIQWQIVEANKPLDETAWNTATGKKPLTLGDLKLKTDKAYDIVVRTAATEKKIASKVGRISVAQPATKLYTSTDAFDSTHTDIVANKLTVKPVLAYDITKGLVIENKDTTKDIEYALVTTGVDSYKWNTLKAPKNADRPTKATLKYSKDAKANTWIAKDGNTKNTVLMVREAGKKQDKNNHVVPGGVTSGAILGFTNISQKLTFDAQTTTADKSEIKIEAATATKAAIKIATGTAATFTIKAKIVDKVVNTKGGTPKLKAVTKLPSGITIKAGKVDGTAGTFDITINVSNKAFKEEPNFEAKYNLKYEGADSDFVITFAKK